jgi:integrase
LSGRILSDALLANYITSLHDNGKSPATIGQVVAAVKWQLKHQSQETVNFPITQATLAGIRREGKDRGRGQVDGLIWRDVERVCVYAETEGTLIGLRDSAMIRLMSDCLLRISEVVAVNVGDFKGSTLTLRSSKTDQEGAGETLYVCENTRELLKQYRERAEIGRGAVFRHIRRGGHVQSERLTPHSARRIIQKRAHAAGVEGFISGHSLRVGSAVSLAQAGATVVDMQVAGRWKSSQMPAHYARAEMAERGAIARYKETDRSPV